MKKPPKKNASTIGRSLKMPAALDAKVQEMADREDRSWSYIVVRAVREMIERAK